MMTEGYYAVSVCSVLEDIFQEMTPFLLESVMCILL